MTSEHLVGGCFYVRIKERRLRETKVTVHMHSMKGLPLTGVPVCPTAGTHNSPVMTEVSHTENEG